MRHHQPQQQRDTYDGHVAGGAEVDVLQVGEDDADEYADGDDLAAAEHAVRDGDEDGAQLACHGKHDVQEADTLENTATSHLRRTTITSLAL